MDRNTLSKVAEDDSEAGFVAALEAIKSEDRNARVLALRIVGANPRPEGATVILAGLSDPKRRVREVALKSSKPYLGQQAVVDRMVQMVEDESEYHRLRAKAMFALGGAYRPDPGYPRILQSGEIPKAALKALESLGAVDRYRQAVLQRLVIMDVTADSAALLQEFVRSGSKEEAVLATRALCGYRHVTWLNPKPEELEAAGAQPGGGGPNDYWIRRDYRPPPG
jgi:HEAT repeat protein